MKKKYFRFTSIIKIYDYGICGESWKVRSFLLQCYNLCVIQDRNQECMNGNMCIWSILDVVSVSKNYLLGWHISFEHVTIYKQFSTPVNRSKIFFPMSTVSKTRCVIKRKHKKKIIVSASALAYSSKINTRSINKTIKMERLQGKPYVWMVLYILPVVPTTNAIYNITFFL